MFCVIEIWRTGDTCLAPDPRDGTLREATIQRPTTSHNNDTKAWVLFDDEEEEEAVPVSKLMRPGSSHFTQEKPVFPSSTTDPRLCVPLNLSDVDGDRVPYTINRYLRDYQREGIRFIYNNYMRSRGCILGDDMGLGKTVQVQSTLPAKLFSQLFQRFHFYKFSGFHAFILGVLYRMFTCCNVEITHSDTLHCRKPLFIL